MEVSYFGPCTNTSWPLPRKEDIYVLPYVAIYTGSPPLTRFSIHTVIYIALYYFVVLFFSLVLNHFTNNTVFCWHGCFSTVSKNRVSRGLPVLQYKCIQFRGLMFAQFTLESRKNKQLFRKKPFHPKSATGLICNPFWNAFCNKQCFIHFFSQNSTK